MTDLRDVFPVRSTAAADPVVSTAPADRKSAEQALAKLFAAAGFVPPRRIVWCDGPLEVSRLREAAACDGSAGPNLAPLLLRLVTQPLSRSLYAEAENGGRMSAAVRYQSLRTSIARHLAEDESRLVSGVMARLRAFASRRRRPVPWNSIEVAGFSQFDAASLAAAARHHLPADDVTRHLADVVSNCGWVVPHEGVVWLSERPRSLLVDERGRLHSRNDAALAYADGWKVYAWKGVRMPMNTIKYADSITVAQIHRVFDPVIRRCMIDIMTPSRFVANGGAHIIARDDTGILWHRRWRSDAWSAVEVVNGSPEPDGSYKHYFLQVPADMRTARQAVAWTYHMSEAQYARLTLRT